MGKKKITIQDIINRKSENKKIAMLTAYDYPLGLTAEEAELDMVLVGDSLGMVVLGLESTVEVTVDDMIHHIKAVVRGCKTPLVVGDMPFMSYNTSIRDAIVNAGRLIKEGGCEAVKLEGGMDFAETVNAVVKAGIPVQGHVGLSPQTAGALGGMKLQGRDVKSARAIIDDALALEQAGVFSIVIEAVPAPLAKIVAEKVSVPVIGIGAGKDVDGQVLVIHDVIGLFDRFTPKFVKQYTNIRPVVIDALKAYTSDVRNGSFPAEEHTFTMREETLEELKQGL
ncbi:MAG: 3-methyl-2-oxobutanoate hydroxymethyltransferase [Thermodesulfobacteriota bacterium]|nr:3-methyl-2-oxobutanoate hydroxymethyltransferase [Thermodesulfobacteriota bacterium]